MRKYINSDQDFDYFVDKFQGIEVRMQIDKKTGELFFNSDDAARCLGYESMSDMLDKEPKAVNVFLDGINNGMVKKG